MSNRRTRIRRAITVLAATLTIGANAVPTPAVAAPPTPPFKPTELFAKGWFGYGCFRIPAIVQTKKPLLGRSYLLAFAEGRRNGCSDTGDIDVVLRRSADGGRTWGGLEVVARGNGDTRGNPSPIVDRFTGRISLLTTHNPGKECEASAPPCTRTPYLQHSLDPAGKRWSAPVKMPNLTSPKWNTWYATGPGHGLQLRTLGAHPGRMVVGINYEGAGGLKGAGLVYSDDLGSHWKLGATSDQTGTPLKPQELSLFERRNGGIYAAARTDAGNKTGTDNRAAAVSPDGGGRFTAPFATVPELLGPVVQNAVVKLAGTGRSGQPDLALFSGPYNNNLEDDHNADPLTPNRRHSMRIRTSRDDGATWQRTGTLIDYTWAGYSDLVDLGGGDFGLYYEAGPKDARDTIRFLRLNQRELDR